MKNLLLGLVFVAISSASFAKDTPGSVTVDLGTTMSSDSVPARLYKAMQELQKADKDAVKEIGDQGLAIYDKKGYGVDCIAGSPGVLAVMVYSCRLVQPLNP